MCERAHIVNAERCFAWVPFDFDGVGFEVAFVADGGGTRRRIANASAGHTSGCNENCKYPLLIKRERSRIIVSGNARYRTQ